MTQNEKDLLLKDLCARLPYRVKVQSTFYNCDGTIWKYENEILTANLLVYKIERYKPYLFPLSSMTEEQNKELKVMCDWHDDDVDAQSILVLYQNHFVMKSDVIDWFNKNHFDYRGLIPIELAIDATGLNIY